MHHPSVTKFNLNRSSQSLRITEENLEKLTEPNNYNTKFIRVLFFKSLIKLSTRVQMISIVENYKGVKV